MVSDVVMTFGPFFIGACLNVWMVCNALMTVIDLLRNDTNEKLADAKKRLKFVVAGSTLLLAFAAFVPPAMAIQVCIASIFSVLTTIVSVIMCE